MSDAKELASAVTRLDEHVKHDEAFHEKIDARTEKLVTIADRAYGGFWVICGLLGIVISLLVSAHPRITFSPASAAASTPKVTHALTAYDSNP